MTKLKVFRKAPTENKEILIPLSVLDAYVTNSFIRCFQCIALLKPFSYI